MAPRGMIQFRHARHNNNGKSSNNNTNTINSQVPRPRTSPGFQQPSVRQSSVQSALNLEDEALPEEEEPAEQIELLEYEWPDLPPIPSMKDAVSRRRVSQGISYLLPVDKGRNSINNRFRTDLRAMFQEPYASDDLQYDDTRVKLSAKVHFLSNSADTKWTQHHLTALPTQLNADSEGARKLYVHSAPTGGVASRRMGIDPTKLRKRSNLFLPVKASKAQVSPEIIKLRNEAAEIIKQGLSYQDDDGELVDKGKLGTANKTNNVTAALFTNPDGQLNGDHHKKPTLTQDTGMLTTFGGSHLADSLGTSALNAKLKSVHIHQEQFADYDQLPKSLPPKPLIPREIQSPFLSAGDNQRVWEWLHYGEAMSAFDFFLSVCG